MIDNRRVDVTDADLLLALAETASSTTIPLAEFPPLSCDAVRPRLARLEGDGALVSGERRVEPAAPGSRLTALITTRVVQRELDAVATHLRAIPQVLQVHGISGDVDLLVHVVASDADDLYRIAGPAPDPGAERTSTSLVMRDLVGFRLTALLRRLAEQSR